MKRFLKVFFIVAGILILLLIGALAYLNFVYLPQKVKAEGAAFLEEKSKGRIQAESIRYIPFRGVELRNTSFLSKTKQPILTLDKLYVNFQLWPLLIRKELYFRIDLYPPMIKKPFVFYGLYQVKKQQLDVDFKLKTDVFAQEQTITGKIQALTDKEEKIDIDLNLSSADLDVQGNFYIQDKNLYIRKLLAKILDSTFDFIGDIQNIPKPSLNIYGNLELNLAGLEGLNPKYYKLVEQVKLDGQCLGEVFIADQASNPQIGLKMQAAQIKVENCAVTDLSIVAKMENKRLLLSKFYARLCEGEVNLQGDCRIDSPGLPATLNINIFNLELNRMFKDIVGKDTPVHGRFFSLGRLTAPLKDPKAVEGELWASASGANILQLPFLRGIVDVLGVPELSKVKFKEASGNFLIAKQAIRTEDLKLISNILVLYFKGYIDFAGDLGFDIEPSFSQSFLLGSPNIANILGVFMDSAGNFLGEIKMKGNIKEPRYTFKPITPEKLFPRGLEEGLMQLFKIKKKEE